MDHFPHPNDDFECHESANSAEPRHRAPQQCFQISGIAGIQEKSIKCKAFESQPAAGRRGSDDFSFKSPLGSLRIHLEASLGLWKTFKKPAAIVRDLQNPQNLTAGQKVVPKRRKNEVRKKV